MDWKPIATAPFDRDVELAVIDRGEMHVLVFACRRADDGWAKTENGERVPIHPTHWREWQVALRETRRS